MPTLKAQLAALQAELATLRAPVAPAPAPVKPRFANAIVDGAIVKVQLAPSDRAVKRAARLDAGEIVACGQPDCKGTMHRDRSTTINSLRACKLHYSRRP